MEVASSAGVGVVVILDVFCRSLDAQVFFLIYVARRCLRVTYLASREERYRRKGTLLVGGVLTGGHVVFSFTAIICTETPPRLPAIAHFVFIHIRLIRVRIRTVLVRMPVAISSVLQQLSHSIWFFRIVVICRVLTPRQQHSSWRLRHGRMFACVSTFSEWCCLSMEQMSDRWVIWRADAQASVFTG